MTSRVRISEDVVGRSLGTSIAAVTPRMTMAYASGIGADDACYLDDLQPGGIVAPPLFCVVLEWPIVSGQLFRDLLGVSEREFWGAVHVLQDSFFHQSIRPGQTLVTTGRIVKVRQTRVGTYVASKVETHDQSTSQPMVTSYFAAIIRGVEVAVAERTLEEPPSFGRSEPGQTSGLERVSIEIPRTMAHVYAECTAIWSPIHTERAFARAKGLPDIILHGTATLALAGQTIMRRFAGGDPARLRRLRCEFKGMVIPGSTISVELATNSSRPSGVEFVVHNAACEAAVREGYAEIVP